MVAALQDERAFLSIVEAAADEIEEMLAAEQSLRSYVGQAWPIIEPTTELVPGFYLDAVCDHLQAVAEGLIRRLLITIPPGFAKSTLVSVLFPTWRWIDHPEHRFLTTSHDGDLATRDAVKARRVISSAWYQRNWGDRFVMTSDQNVKTRYENDRTGYRVAAGVNARLTGERADTVTCDDPHNVKDIESDTVREGVIRWWAEAMSSRLNDPKTGSRIVIQQRVHERDLAGVLAEQGYEHLNLPMEYEPTTYVTSIGWKDPRTEPGELLHPVRYGPDEVQEKKTELGTYAYAAQYQQRPVPSAGGMFKRHWWRYWQPRGGSMPPVEVKMPDGSVNHVYAEELPAWWYQSAQSWDMTFKETKSGSYVVGLVGATHGPNSFVLDLCRDRMEFTDAVKAVRRMTQAHPTVGAKLIEDKANGPAVISELQSEISGLLPVPVQGSKEARAAAATPRVEAGNWYLPHPELPGAEWVPAFIHELASFPSGAHDDQVDAFSQIDHYFATNAAVPQDIDDYFTWKAGSR